MPVVGDLICSFHPVLNDRSENSRVILGKIVLFLRKKGPMHASGLRDEVPEELFTALRGVKLMRQNHKLNAIALKMEYQKQQTLDWVAARLKQG